MLVRMAKAIVANNIHFQILYKIQSRGGAFVNKNYNKK